MVIQFEPKDSFSLNDVNSFLDQAASKELKEYSLDRVITCLAEEVFQHPNECVSDLIQNPEKIVLWENIIRKIKVLQAPSKETDPIENQILKICKTACDQQSIRKKDTSLHVAVRLNQVEAVKTLTKGGVAADLLEVKDNTPSITPLELAIHLNKPEMIESLVKAGANINLPNKYGNTPLSLAVWWNQPEMVPVLVESGADVNLPNGYGKTPLEVALDWNKPEMVQAFVKAGAKVNLPNKYGHTPLELAVYLNKPEMAQALVKAGADVNFPNKFGLTPLELAIRLNKPEMIKSLVGVGANVNLPNKYGNTPLSLAVWWNQPKMIQVLVEAGADVNLPSGSGDTPLSLTVLWNKPQMLQAIVQAGANINLPSVNKEGNTPLSLAVCWNRPELVKTLVKAGADIGCTTRSGASPFDLAYINDNEVMKSLLKELGGDEVFAANVNREVMLAHLWGIKGTSQIRDKNGRVSNRNLEGQLGQIALRDMSAYLQEFVEKNPHIFSKSQKKYLRQAVTNRYPGKSLPEILTAWKSGQPCTILTQSENHGVGIVLNGNILTVSNRGLARRSEATQMFVVPKSCKTLGFLQQLCSECPTIEGFYEILSKTPGLQTINTPIRHKDQKIGNCSTASLKAAIHVLFFLCKGKKHQEAREIYKQFTAFLRVRSLEDYKAKVLTPSTTLLQQIEEKAARKGIELQTRKPDVENIEVSLPNATGARHWFFYFFLKIGNWVENLKNSL